jgi:hypothetical protein
MIVRDIKVGSQFQPVYAHSVPNGSGPLFWDNHNHKFFVIDEYGNKHEFYPDTPSVDLQPHYQHALDWAYNKMMEEKNIEDLCKKHPGLKDAKEAFELMRALCKP